MLGDKMRNHVIKARMHKRLRSKTGSVLVIIVAVICLIIVPMIIISSRFGMYTVDKGRIQNLVEAAGLLAANDLSRIIINDPNFGYVSLSNYAPIGRGTLAADGEPLPVTSINTLVGTVRQNAIVAKELGNPTMTSLVERDNIELQRTIASLNAALSESLVGNSKQEFTDMQGAKVEPLKDVTKFLKVNLPINVELESIKLSNGWLSDGARTTIPVSKPERLAEIKPTDSQQGFLKPFVNLPVSGDTFSFAGLGASSTIVLPAGFRPADKNHICSIIKVECILKVHRPGTPFGGSELSKIPAIACCQPYSLPDVGPGGVMTLRFTGGPVAGLTSWSDFLRDGNFKDRQINTYDVVGGDDQIDKEARKRSIGFQPDNSTTRQFSENLYYWLRSGHLRPRIDAITEMVNEQFKLGPNDLYAYEFAQDGTISRRIIDRDPFPIGATSDAQFSTLADTRIQNDKTPIIIFRNNVKRLGSINGGKHGGQPLAGLPVNWSELQEYGGSEQIASKLSKGRLGTGLVMDDPNYLAAANTKDPLSNIFKTMTGQTAMQPRKSFYSGGLALDIEIGGTKPSTASIDVARMRKLKR
jgi:hypothetical protein